MNQSANDLLDFEEIGQDPIENLTDKDVYTKIWLEPRRVFRFIEGRDYVKHMYLIIYLAGVSGVMDRAVDKGGSSSTFTVLLSAMLFGLISFLGYFVFAWVLSKCAGWLGGKSNRFSTMRVLAYSNIPTVLILALKIIFISVYDPYILVGEFFSSGMGPMMVAGIALGLIQLVAGIWTLVLNIVGISEINGFGIGRSIGALLLSVLVFVGVFMAIGLTIFSALMR